MRITQFTELNYVDDTVAFGNKEETLQENVDIQMKQLQDSNMEGNKKKTKK